MGVKVKWNPSRAPRITIKDPSQGGPWIWMELTAPCKGQCSRGRSDLLSNLAMFQMHRGLVLLRGVAVVPEAAQKAGPGLRGQGSAAS